MGNTMVGFFIILFRRKRITPPSSFASYLCD